MTVKVEIGFTEDGQGAPFFTLDDPVLGRLDNPQAFLGGGEIFVDVSENLQSYSLTRGKSRELDRYQAGQASATFENNLRTFDPTFVDSPFFGQILPKRNIRISNDDIIQFLGVIEDWNISYDAGGQSVATCQAFDSFSFLTNVNLTSANFIEQDTGDRIDAVLDVIGWSENARSIDTGGAIVAAQTISEDIAALDYMQIVSRSDPGDLFLSKNGLVKFAGRNTPFTSSGPILSDDGQGIAYKTIQVIFGSEQLFNNVTVTSSAGQVTAINTTSRQQYGERDLEEQTFLSDVPQLQLLANYLVKRYGEPEFRFEGLTVDLNAISTGQKTQILDLELADIIKVEFTPNGIGDAIERFGKVIGITQNVNPSQQEVNLKLQTTEGAFLVLGDNVFGKLDSGNILGW